MRVVPLLLVVLLTSVALAGCARDEPAPSADPDLPTPTEGASANGVAAAPPQCMALVRGRLAQAAEAAGNASSSRGSGTVTLLTHDSFSVPASLLDEFTNRTGWEVAVVKMGDAGEALNKAILQKEAPVGDVLFGVDNALVFRARAHDLFQPYESPRLAGVDDRFAEPFCHGGRMLATPVDYGYVQLNYDVGWFQERGLAPPKDLKDVANATYAPLTVVQHPQTSSPGFAFLLATVDRFGEEGEYTYRSWWSDFVKNGGKVVSGWEQAYGDEFTQGWTEGAARDRPLVVSYSTSPAYVPMNGWGEAATATLDLPKGAWFQVESVGILRHARHVEGARALVDFLLDPTFQEGAAFAMVVHPVHRDAEAPEAYALHAPEPAEPASLPPERIDAMRDAWLAGWRQATGKA